MASSSESNPTDLCRVCIQDVTAVPSQNIFESTSPDYLSIHCKLSTICPQVFSTESVEQKPFANNALPLNVCNDCKAKIDGAYELHQMCLESNRKLWAMLTAVAPTKVAIKEEVEDAIQIEPLIEPDELESPKVYADYLDDPLEKSAPKAESKVRKLKTNESKVKRSKMKDPKNVQCEICSFDADREQDMYKHMKRKHASKIFKCADCAAAYFTEAKLEEHKVIHTIAKPYPCPNCNKFFKNKRNVVIHSVQCSGKTPYQCTECGKAFPYTGSLQQHLLRHKEKAFACDQCPSKFHTKGALQGHMRTHTKEKNFACELCETRCVTKYALRQHMFSHTDERPHACDLCDLRFRSSDNLRRHRRIHTGEKPYKCTHCDRAFSQTNDLVKHSKTHFGDNPYKCDRCDEAFRLLTDLRNHYKVHYQSGKGQDSDLPDTITFTSVSILKRRAEQERNQDHSNTLETAHGYGEET